MKACLVLLCGCGFSMHTSGGFTSSGGSAPVPAASEPVAAAPARQAAPGKTKRDGDDDGRPGSSAPLLGAAPEITAPGPLAGADWNGKYDAEAPYCSDPVHFDLAGPDVQTVRSDGWNYSPGFKCPMTCINPSKATVAKGKLAFPLVWVEDHPPMDDAGTYTITMRRYKFEIPLGKTDAKTTQSGTATYKTPPFKWSHNNVYEMRSDAFSVAAGVQKVADVHTGTGRVALIKLSLHDPEPGAPQYEWLDDAEAGCNVLLSRDDWKAGDGLSDDDGGKAVASSGSPSHSSSNSGARQHCKSSCKSAAGSCRTSCHGQSAKCASACNHDESACERSCG